MGQRVSSEPAQSSAKWRNWFCWRPLSTLCRWLLFCQALSITDITIASEDIRNMIKSLTGLPANYAGHCKVVVNDKDSDIVARNAILLLTALQFSPDEATPMMLHIWYSALIPAQTLRSLWDSILPLIQEVCKKNSGEAGSIFAI